MSSPFTVNAYLLRDRIGWFGDHTGYEQLSRFLAKEQSCTVSCIAPHGGSLPRVFGKLTSLALGHGNINQAQAWARLLAFVQLSLQRDTILHILYGEEHARYWGSFPAELHSRTVLTFHQPPAQWSPEAISSLQWVQHAIVLYRRDLQFFKEAMPKANIQFIPYGVDVDFFSPPITPPHGTTKRILYNGVHLRNVVMLQQIVPAITASHPEVAFDFLVPLHRRDERIFGVLLHHPAIKWHAGLDDQSLLSLYRNSYLMLLPMNDSGANTAVVEALSCGLPIITTDVGGIRDYGGGAHYPVVKNNDVTGMLAEVGSLLSCTSLRQERSESARQFAENTLAWPVIADRHSALYKDLLR